MRIRIIGLVLAAMALAGCEDPTEPLTEALTVRASPTGLTLVNASSVDLFYFALDEDLLATWVGPDEVTRCQPETSCPHLAPGATRMLAWPEVNGWRQETRHVAVTWWQVARGNVDIWKQVGDRVFSASTEVPR